MIIESFDIKLTEFDVSSGSIPVAWKPVAWKPVAWKPFAWTPVFKPIDYSASNIFENIDGNRFVFKN